MIDAVISRLEAQVPELTGRVEGAAQFAELLRTKNLPQHTPAAHVIPMGMSGGQPDASAGAFLQVFRETVAVMLTLRSNDPTGRRALSDVRGLIDSVNNAICGWSPGSEIGVFELGRAFLASMSAGTLVYQIEFIITDQLRIIP